MATEEKKQLTFEFIKAILIEEYFVNKEDIKMESNLTSDLGLDDLDIVEFCIDIEEKANIFIPESDIEGKYLVKDYVDVLAELLPDEFLRNYVQG